jgi:ssDNA-binding Zn-finger/Zn-ribbon topoisomerase 1
MTTSIQINPKPPCPKCGAMMRLKKRHADGKQFWSCGLWPDCDGTRGIGSDGKPIFDEIRQEFTTRDFE